MAGGMECLIGMKFDSFVILAHDNSAGRSVLMMKQDQDKLVRLDDRLGMVVCGEAGDTAYFGEYIQKNVALYRVRNGYELSPHAAANFTRLELAESIRSRSPQAVNLLLGGFDAKEAKTHLYYLDYLGTMADVPYGAHGYGSYFTLGTLDRYHRPDMSEEEGVHLLEKCVREIQLRFLINLASFSYYIISTEGFSDRRIITVGDIKTADKMTSETPAAMATS
ncbi:Proteasome subunit beta type-2 [Geodia barretti]|uniref:Proteasome subunit beta n=1 Tax=Geodia barretti TaxID=519541 RepID=A0AA35STG6_GEOBA|nr:Proteasome subunit beta type-2 [Geodia barretti]